MLLLPDLRRALDSYGGVIPLCYRLFTWATDALTPVDVFLIVCMLNGVSAEDVTDSKGFSQCLDVCARDLAIDQACDIRLAVTDSIIDGPLLAPAGISLHSKCRAFYRISWQHHLMEISNASCATHFHY